MKTAFLRLSVFVGFLTACNPPPDPNCYKPFEKSVEVVRHGSSIEVPINELEFLFDPNLILDDIDLIVTLKGKHSSDEEIELDLNGIKVNRQDGHKHCDRTDYDDKNDWNRNSFKLHKFFLNGAKSFLVHLLMLKKNKGKLVINFHTKRKIDGKIQSVELVFKGRIYDKKNCAKPSPAPTPTATPIDVTAYAPTINSTNPSVSPTALTTMSIVFSARNTGGSFFCSLDGAAATLCQSPMNYSGLSNGSHTFQVSGRAPNGQNAGSASYSWVVDSVAPSVNIDNAAVLPSLSNQNSIQFLISSSEPGTFVCSLDGSAASDCTSPVAYSGLSEGTHSFQVSVRDSLGNTSAPASFQWAIDMTSPVATIVNVEPSEGISNNDSRSFSFISNEVSTFECSLDSMGFVACDSPANYSSLAEGNHWFEVRATDVAGNVSVPVSYSWVVDRTPPNLAIDSVYPTAGLTNAENASVSFSSDEPTTFLCSFDGSAEAECSSPFVTAMGEGSHQFVVVAEDAAGNRSAAAVVDWVVDLTAPIISFGNFEPSSNAYINSSDFRVSVNASENLALTVNLNGSPIPSSDVIELLGLAEGNYVLSVVGVDSAGNTSNVITHSFVVDLTAPIMSITSSGTSPTSSDLRNFTFSADEEVSFACDLDSAGFASCSSPLQYSGLADGQHVFSLRGTDLAGNSSLLTYSWIVDTTPIHTQIVSTNPSALLTNSTSMLITFGADQATSGYLCSLNGGSEVSCDASMQYSSLLDGQHTFLVRAIDEFGVMDTTGASHTWTVDTIAPVPSNIGSAATQTTITVTWATSESATQQLLWGLGGTGTINNSTPESTTYSTSHSMQLSGLVPNTLYSFQVAGHDQAGNQYVSGPFSVRTRR